MQHMQWSGRRPREPLPVAHLDSWSRQKHGTRTSTTTLACCKAFATPLSCRARIILECIPPLIRRGSRYFASPSQLVHHYQGVAHLEEGDDDALMHATKSTHPVA